MSLGAWAEGATPGVRVLRHAVGGWAWSPDDRYLACWELPAWTVRVVEVASGREVLAVPGGEVGSLVWVSPEALWVVRRQEGGETRVVAHAVPDGGVMGVAALPRLRTQRYRVTAARDGSRVLMAPWAWNGGARSAVRVRTAYVLRGEVPEVLAELDPDAVEAPALPRLPVCRQAVAALGPDGRMVAIGYGGTEAPAAPVPGPVRGSVAFYDLATGRVGSVVGGGRLPVEGVHWAGPSVVIVEGRGSFGGAGAGLSGEVLVVDVARGEFVYDSGRDGATQDRVATWGVELHPDRVHLLVKGWAGSGGAGEPLNPALHVVDLDSGRATARREFAAGRLRGFDAVWRGAGDALAVFTCKKPWVFHVGWWASLADGERGEGRTFTVERKSPPGGRLERSRGGRYFALSWQESALTPQAQVRSHLAVIDPPEET